MRFKDRLDVAHMLVRMLEKYKGTHPSISTIPGGVASMGAFITSALGDQFDVALVHKLGTPFSSGLAVGSMEKDGWSYITLYVGCTGTDTTYLEQENAEWMEVIRWCRTLYTPGHGPHDAEGRTMIVADDGLATGASMKVVLHVIWGYHPQRLVYMVPVTASGSLGDIRPLAGEIVCLYVPQGFRVVGTYYVDFPQVEDIGVRVVPGAALQIEHRAS